MSASTTASRCAAGITGWTNARRASTCWTLDADGLAAGAPRDLLVGTKLAASPGFAGRQTDTGEELDMEFTPDSRVARCSPRPPTAMPRRTRSPIRSCSSSTSAAASRASSPPAGTSGRSRASRPMARTLLAVLETQGTRRLQPVASRGTCPGRQPRHAARDHDRPRSLGEQLRGHAGFAHGVLHRRGWRPREAVLGAHRTAARCRRCSASRRARTRTSPSRTRAANVALYANWESASSPGEVARVHRRAARRWCSPSSTPRAPRSSTCRPSRTSGSRAAAASASTASWCARRASIASKKYPLFVVIHGGPHGMWRDQFFIRWNYHLLAAPGYVLLLTNYSGSTGFGEEFARSIQGDPLKGPGDEINEAADAAISEVLVHRWQPRSAPAARATAGISSNWLQATTTRYKCLVSHAGPRESRGAVGHERHHLLARSEHGRPAVGAGAPCGASRTRSATPRSSARRCW